MDTHVRSPFSVFTVEDHIRPSATVPLPVRKTRISRGSHVFIWLLLVLAILALCAAAAEIYILKTVQNKLEDTQEMVNVNIDAQKMIGSPGKRELGPSAHVIGTQTAAHPGNHLQWETSEGLAFLNKVVYKNGSLYCTQPGLYFVYSKLQLGSRECKFADVTSSFFTHGVYRKSPTTGFEEKLLENSRRFCDSQGKDLWKESSYLAGTFRLETGDDIYVKFSQKQLIRESDGTTNFFGLFML